jgi:monoamine oxidase
MVDQKEFADVVIVGAGISGLAVADTLIRSGNSVALLEARDRIGGRLLGSPLDLGASWFWPGEQRVPALAQRFGVETFDQYRHGDAIIDDLSGVQRYPGNPIDVPAYRIVGGTSTLAAALADQLPAGTLYLDHPVHEITDDLTVVTNDRVWQADHVVIALPPALAVRTIKLPSELPPELIDVASRTPVWMGDSVKVVALFSEPFWRRDGFAGAAMSRRGPLAEIHDMSGPDGEPAALFGFARAASMHPDIETDIRKQLTRMFGPGASAPTDLLIHDWSREQWTTPPSHGGSPEYGLFGHPLYRQPALGGRLHWSSTETAQSFAGHIEGALEAAERSVAALVKSPGECR